MGEVVTVLGPIPQEQLGVTDAHDHLFLRSPALPGQDFDDVDKAIEEVRGAASGGLQAVVELTPIGLGRRPAKLRAVSESAGVHIVAATGYHRDAHYEEGHWVRVASVEMLAERILADLQRGMHPEDWLTDSPLDSARAGVNPGRIILAHLDRNPDFELHAEIAARGVALEYDTPGRIKYRPDSQLIELVEAMVRAGHDSALMLGLDLGQRDYFRSYGGGPGLAYLMDSFVPRLRRRVGDDVIRKILVDTPARAFAMSLQ